MGKDLKIWDRFNIGFMWKLWYGIHMGIEKISGTPWYGIHMGKDPKSWDSYDMGFIWKLWNMGFIWAKEKFLGLLWYGFIWAKAKKSWDPYGMGFIRAKTKIVGSLLYGIHMGKN